MNHVDNLLTYGTSRDTRSAIASCGRELATNGEGRNVSNNPPLFDANDTALLLLKDMAEEQRRTREVVDKLAIDAARTEGQGIPARVDGHANDIRLLRLDIAALNSRLAIDDARRQPWLFVVREVTKGLLALAIGAGAAVAGLNAVQHH